MTAPSAPSASESIRKFAEQMQAEIYEAQRVGDKITITAAQRWVNFFTNLHVPAPARPEGEGVDCPFLKPHQGTQVCTLSGVTPPALDPPKVEAVTGYEDIAEFLGSIGWKSVGDAQWTRLRDSIPALRHMLATPPAAPSAKVPDYPKLTEAPDFLNPDGVIGWAIGWDACRAETLRLNGPAPSDLPAAKPVAWLHPEWPGVRVAVPTLNHRSIFEVENNVEYTPVYLHPAPAADVGQSTLTLQRLRYVGSMNSSTLRNLLLNKGRQLEDSDYRTSVATQLDEWNSLMADIFKDAENEFAPAAERTADHHSCDDCKAEWWESKRIRSLAPEAGTKGEG